MFGFGLKLKAKPKPTISAVRRPRDQVVETSQKNDTVGQTKQSSIENISQNSNSEKSEFEQSEKTTSTVVSDSVHQVPGHLESGNINNGSKKGTETTVRTDSSSSSHVITLETDRIGDNDRNSSNSTSDDRDITTASESNISTAVSTESEVNLNEVNSLDETSSLENSVISKNENTMECISESESVNPNNNRQKTVPFIPKLLPKKNKFVPNVRVNRKTDDQSDKSTSNSPQKNSSTFKIEANNLPIMAAAISEPHVDSDNIISKTEETSEMSEAVIRNEIRNQSTTNEQSHSKEPPVAESLHVINPPKELLSPIKHITEQSADKENTVFNDNSQTHYPGSILQNSKKKKPKAQGTFLQMTIEAKKELNEKFKDGKLDKSKLIMRDLIHYNPPSNPMLIKSRSKGIKEEKKCKVETKSLEEEILSEQSVDDVEATRDSDASSMPVPQLKVGPDGKIILDSSSLVIETTGTEKSRADLQNSELVEENEFSGFKYRKRRARRNDWSAEETLLFYKALNDIGADFSMMERLFPSRTRRDLKLKFKKEEKSNLSLVDKAMTHKGKFDFEALQEEIKRDREERSRRQEEEARLKELAKKQLKLQKMEAKILKANEKLLKAENSRKLKEEKRESKQNKSNSRKGVNRNQKLSANKEKQSYKRSKRKLVSYSRSDCSDDYEPKYSFEKRRKRGDDDFEHMRYDTIFKTTKSGRCPRVKNTILEQSEDEEQQHSDSVNSEKSEESEINLFEDLPIPDETEELENNRETSVLNVGSRLPIQNLPQTIKIVEELTRGIPRGTVNVNGVKCKIIALNNEDNEFSGSSSFLVGDSQENNSDCSIRLESVEQSAETGCQQMSYVINYDENNGESIELSSGMITDGETYPIPRPHCDHSYSMDESPPTDDDDDDYNNAPVKCKSYVVLEPNESVEIYNES
ncbi:hypothetical protein LSTR_LSTR000586 [Laodelphax striatellus]|uniref:Myb-like domain-containing protein n=2 Tax=Laodelphax striatellus TaxID=195883 RepID=A0A482XFZ8_LAOST|nr:hypothetical protein LSTR_LSTR000586 [Laodelphax striatellus]